MTESYKVYAKKSAEETAHELRVDPASGLSRTEAEARLEKYGRNSLDTSNAGWWRILARQFRSPFTFLLLGAGSLSFFLGETLDGALIILFIAVNAGLGFFQEYRSEHTLALLKRYLLATAVARREGAEVQVEKTLLVPGDIVILQPGDIVPADVRLIEASGVAVNESVLTGESESASKGVRKAAHVSGMYDAGNMCFAGTTMVSGRAEGIVCATGRQSSLGAISALAAGSARESGFEKGMRQVSSMILKVVAVTFLLMVLLKWLLPWQSTPFLDFLIFSIALAVSVIPEGLPLVITFTLSHGARILARNKVVVKRLSAIEDLGSIDVLCTDKTGTLTQNKMRIAAIYGQEDRVLHCARMGEAPRGRHVEKNSFDEALSAGMTKEERMRLASYEVVNQVPFDPLRRRHTVVTTRAGAFEMSVRGAPEDVLSLCKKSAHAEAGMRAFLKQEGEKGHRVLAVAHKKLSGKTMEIAGDEHGLELMGCVSFYDPLKDTAIGAVKKANAMGVQVKILTGDSAEVSEAVAFATGLLSNGESVLTGAAFDALPPEEQRHAVESHHVFARVSPEQKFAIIKLLEASHDVGFLGEGINDAPALKAANIGLVVHNASDVARESADIMLLTKDLSVIVNGIEEGRRVFGNSVKYLKATLASNFGNFYAVVAASFLGGFLPMLPVQILLLNLLSDFPMMAIARDSVEKSDLKRPRHYDIRDIALISILLGFVSTVFDFLFFAIFYRLGPEALRTNWFMGSVLTELALLFSIRTHLPMFRSGAPSRIVFVLTGIAAILTIALPFTPIGQSVFRFVPPTPADGAIIAGLLGGYLVCTEMFKLMYYRRTNGKTAKQLTV